MPSTSAMPLATPVVPTLTVASPDALLAGREPMGADCVGAAAGAHPDAVSPARAGEPPMNRRLLKWRGCAIPAGFSEARVAPSYPRYGGHGSDLDRANPGRGATPKR